MPHFVVLEHDHPSTHWDLMFETGSTLRTWRLASVPTPGNTVEATALADHRLLYLDYEGPISGNRGRVLRWDFGTFEAREWSEKRIVAELQGTRLCGTLTLEQIAGQSWCCVWHAKQSPSS